MVMMQPKPPIGIQFPPRPITLPNTADQATFQVLDGDGDNKVSRDEWIRAGWTADRFEAFDGDGDGNVSQQEFMQARRFEKEFNQKDWNGNGDLSRLEMNGFQNIMYKAKQMGNIAIDGINKCFPGFKDRFGSFDTDGNGQVSKKEYIDGRRKEESFIRPFQPHPFPIYNLDNVRPTLYKGVEAKVSNGLAN
ncbi:MAG: hypothetical protein JWM80_5421 [Cyanobacteria bacterium RYN_339]|nr:hypothetical protein [Cyanobacteria bacterium RYN_339]